MAVTIQFSDFAFRAGGFEIAVLSVSREPPRYPWAIAPHAHNSFELHYIQSGTGRFIGTDTEFSVCGGDVAVTGPSVLHAQTSGTDDPMAEVCLNVGLTPLRSAKPDDDLHRLLRALIDRPFFTAHAPDLADDCAALYAEAASPGGGTRALLTALALALLIRTARLAQTAPAAPAPAVPDVPNRRRMVDTYLRGYRTGISAQALADLLFLSRRQADRVVQAYYGCTFTEKLNQLRCAYARRLLQTTDRTVADIAADAGFSSTQYFYRVFQSIYHHSPGAARRNIPK